MNYLLKIGQIVLLLMIVLYILNLNIPTIFMYISSFFTDKNNVKTEIKDEDVFSEDYGMTEETKKVINETLNDVDSH